MKFETAVLEKNYGDADFVNALSGTGGRKRCGIYSSDPAVASVDSKTGEVRILKAGTVQITASASETADYAAADISYTPEYRPARSGLGRLGTDGCGQRR